LYDIGGGESLQENAKRLVEKRARGRNRQKRDIGVSDEKAGGAVSGSFATLWCGVRCFTGNRLGQEKQGRVTEREW
jgi:hypothetical protein